MWSIRLKGARLASGVAVAGILGLTAGCAGGPTPSPQAREEIVAQRSQQRWDALVAGDVSKAYGYFSPATRQTMTLLGYASSVRVGFWKAAKVERVECAEEDLCEVHLKIEYVRGSTIATPLRESWARSGGEWWYVQK